MQLSILMMIGLVFNATFNNITVISWWRKLEYPEKTTDLPQVTDKLYHIMLHEVYHIMLHEVQLAISGI